MLAHLPIQSVDEYGQINNLNMRQLNSMFERIYLNDLYLSALLSKTPTVYEHGKTYNKNDCVWMNTEHYLEFIDFPSHAMHIVSAYNSITAEYPSLKLTAEIYGGSYPVDQLGYNQESNRIQISSSAGTDWLEIPYETNEDLCKSLIGYSYVIGDLSAPVALYRCVSDGIQASTVTEAGELKRELDSDVWSDLYINNDSINTSYISALVRTVLSVHAMSFYPVLDEQGDRESYNCIVSSDIGRLEFEGSQISDILPGYTPYRSDTGQVSSINIQDIVLNDIDPSISLDSPPEHSDVDAQFWYYKYDEASRQYVKTRFKAGSQIKQPEKIWFLHGEKEQKNIDAAAANYVDIATFNVLLSSVYSVTSQNPLRIEVRQDVLSTLNYVVYQQEDTRNTTRIWLDGTVEWFGSNTSMEGWPAQLQTAISSSQYSIQPVERQLLTLSSQYGQSGRTSYYAQCKLDPAYTLSVLALAGVSVPAIDFMNYANLVIIKKDMSLAVDTGGSGVSSYFDVEANVAVGCRIWWNASKGGTDVNPEFVEYSSGEALVNALYADGAGNGVYTITLSAVADSAEYNDASGTYELSVLGPYDNPYDGEDA